MLDLLTMPELWAGLGVVGMIAYLLNSSDRKKREQARFDRIQGKRKKFSASTEQQSLRRKDPNEGSMIARSLAGFSSTAKLRGRLETAGHVFTLQSLARLVIGLFFATLFVVTFILGKKLVIGLLVALVASVGIPNFLINRKIRKRQLLFLRLFPEAIELIVRGLRAGLPVTESLQTVARELPPPVGDTFTTICQQMHLGMPMERALTEAAEKISLTEFNFFVTTIIMQRETGGNLGEILSNLADILRQRHMMKLKIKALCSEARASAMIVGSLPFVVFGMLELVSPQYLSVFFNDSRGNTALLGALGTIGLGAFIMQQMTKLEI